MEKEEKEQAVQGIWSADTVRKLLLNTIYKGVYYFGKTKRVLKKGEYTAKGKPKYKTIDKPFKEWIRVNLPIGIIDEDLWERAREQIQKFNKNKRGKGTAYIFTGLIKCGFDGMSYIHYPRTKEGVLYHYYRCGGTNTSKMDLRKKDTDKGILIAPICNNLQVPEKELYDKCITVIKEFINEPEKLYKDKIGNSNEVKIKLEELNANVIKYDEELKETNKTINGLIYKVAESPALEENYKNVIEKYTRDKNTLIKTLEDTKKSIRLVEQQLNSGKELKNFAKTYKNKLEDLTIEQGTELIRLLVEKIEVKGTLINIFFKFKPHPESLLNNAESVKKNYKNLEVGDFGVYSDSNSKCLQNIKKNGFSRSRSFLFHLLIMNTKTLTWTKPERQTTRSKVMFIGDFKEELQKTVDVMEELIESELPKHIQVDSVISGRNEIKIRINDEEKGITRRISCIFRYHHDEMRFGNIRIEFNIHELSRETGVHFIGVFKITDRENIGKAILEDLVRYAVKE